MPFQSFSYTKGVIKMERVEKRFTRMLSELAGLRYRLDILGHFSLEFRKLRGDFRGVQDHKEHG